jgi:cystathionine beta-lyase
MTLKRMGIETTYYDPTIGADIAALMRPNTKVVFTESPGSETLEVQDIPAIAAAAHAHGACVIMDNTWATPLFFPPHARGVDVAVEAGTKYLSGHADLLLGLVSANAEWFERLHQCVHLMAIPPGAEDVFLALRGLRTMDLRLREAERQGLALAQWLRDRPEVLRVIHPALPDHPGHALWKRDYSGSSGLFSIVLKPASEAAVAAFLDGLELFGIGFSWGGYESLAVPFDCTASRTATRFSPGGPTVRFSVGLEDIEDLKADLERGFARLKATA